MKKLAYILAIGLMATVNAHAVNLLQGNRELGVNGMVDFDTVDDTLISADVAYGYFWADFVESGVRAGISDSSSVSTWRLEIFTEYHFFAENLLVPYVGLSVDLLGSNLEYGEVSSDETAIAVGVDLGVKYFVTDAVAISTQLGLDAASGDVYPAEDGPEDTNWDISLGIRYFF